MRDSLPTLMPFEVFLLFCAKTGMESPYAIMIHTGVGVGASSPSLKRLETQGLLTSTPGPRNRMSYSITEKGEALLRQALDAGPEIYGRPTVRGTYESIHRVIFFAWLKGRLDEAEIAINMAEQKLMKRARLAQAEANECREVLTESKSESSPKGKYAAPEYLSAGYKLIKATADAAEAKLQVEALATLRRFIDQLPSAPKTFLHDSLNPPTSVAEDTKPASRAEGVS